MVKKKLDIGQLRQIIEEETKKALAEFRKRTPGSGPPKKKAPSKQALVENIGFATQRPTSVIPGDFGDFRKCLHMAFARFNLKGLAGRTADLTESAGVATALDRMWSKIEREMQGNLGCPPPVFREGREFWTYFGPDLHEEISRMIESNLQGSKLVKGNSESLATSVIDALKVGF